MFSQLLIIYIICMITIFIYLLLNLIGTKFRFIDYIIIPIYTICWPLLLLQFITMILGKQIAKWYD